MSNKFLNKLERRIVDISFKKKLSHLGSCLTAVQIIDHIFKVKKPDEKFILSSGHAGLALYVIIEKEGGKNAEKIFDHHGVHPDRCSDCDIDCSTGSLGQGLPIAVGMALANRKKNVWCLISDGECAEGSVWEALRIAAENRLENLKVVVNCNSYGAYGQIDVEYLEYRLKTFYPLLFMKTNMFKYPDFLNGLEAHYHVLSEDEYKGLTVL